METASLAFSVAQTLLAALQSPEIRDLFSMWGYKSNLEELERTVKTINSVLLSADSKQVLTPQERDFIDNLKDVVYEADDLIDEFLTTVALQQQHQSRRKVRKFISSIKKLGFGYEMSRKVKNIREMLDRVADDASKFSFKIDDLPIRKRREEMSYIVNVDDIVGRDDEKNEIIETLLNPNCGHEHIYVVTIVGMGGLGKTCLAQLVYNDHRIQKEFPLTLWVCVSDEGKNKFDVKSILVNILKSTGESHIDDLNLVQIADKLKEKLVKSSRYLLVLDDVWTENRNDWVKFKDCLSGLCQTGNKIVVTTRSEGTAKAVGSNRIHKLKGLLDEHSWRLFEMAVGSARANSTDFEQISRDIVKKCHNVPLALKVVGNLLYAQEKKIWVSFQNSKLSEVRKTENDIMPILEFSYRSLSPSLKSCFTYCALFPKDFEFNKEKLLDLWMAQGYVEPLDEGQNIEDAAEEYFQILARRCFFQDLENNQYDEEVVSFKIHDLMHDLAQQVAGEEISIANSTTSTVGKRIRHVYDDSPRSRTQGFTVEAKIRTYLKKNIYHISQYPVSTLLAKWRSLRTLDMRYTGLSSLPDTIGQLLHLRYLDLSYNGELEMLPKSLTKLINLQFLNLYNCYKLKELPGDLSKLVNLRTLYVPFELEHMPAGLARMTHLTRLNYFIVNQSKSCLKVEELRGLRNLKGSLGIRVRGKYEDGKEYCGGGEYMCNTVGEHLNSILIDCWDGTNDEQVLEDLQPHSTNLKELIIWSYSGVRMGGWAREDSLTTSLPNLVNIEIGNCDGLEELPWLGGLQHLKSLSLESLKKVEYMENRRSTGVGSSSDDGAVASNSSTSVESSILLFFPSLEELNLIGMTKLKGWWMGEDEIVNPPAQTLPSFPRLSKLRIDECPKLTSFPLCPCVEDLELKGLNERFQRIIIERGEMGVGSSSGKIREIRTDKLLYPKLQHIPTLVERNFSDRKIARERDRELYPPEIKHALHHHSLKLDHGSDTCECDACDKRIPSGACCYSCRACDFDLDLICAGISEITVPSQQESPIIYPRNANLWNRCQEK